MAEWTITPLIPNLCTRLNRTVSFIFSTALPRYTMNSRLHGLKFSLDTAEKKPALFFPPVRNAITVPRLSVCPLRG